MAIVAAATGRPIRFQAQAQSEAREEMRAIMPEPFVDALFRFFADAHRLFKWQRAALETLALAPADFRRRLDALWEIPGHGDFNDARALLLETLDLVGDQVGLDLDEFRHALLERREAIDPPSRMNGVGIGTGRPVRNPPQQRAREPQVADARMPRILAHPARW